MVARSRDRDEDDRTQFSYKVKRPGKMPGYDIRVKWVENDDGSPVQVREWYNTATGQTINSPSELGPDWEQPSVPVYDDDTGQTTQYSGWTNPWRNKSTGKTYANLGQILESSGPDEWQIVGDDVLKQGDIVDYNSWLESVSGSRWAPNAMAKYGVSSPEDILNSPISTFRRNADGTLSYRPDLQTVIPSYNGEDSNEGFLHDYGRLLFSALATGGFGLAGGAGAAGAAGAAGGAMDMGVGLGGSLGSWGGITPLAEGAAGLGAGAAGAYETLTNLGEYTNAFAPTTEIATNFGTTPVADFSLLPQGATLPNAGLGLNTGGIGLTENLINMGGGAAAMGVPGGLGLNLGTEGLISQTAIDLGLPSDYQPTNPSQVTQSSAPVENRTTPGNKPGTTVGPNGQVIQPINPVTGTAAATVAKLIKDATGYDIDPGLIDVAGKVIGTGLGMYGASQQADATKAISDQYFGLGAPYRNELQNLNANPSSFYQSPIFQGALQQGSDALSRSLSAKVGNPILNPGALQNMQDYTTKGSLDAYNTRWNQLASAGQLGVSQSAPLSQNAIQAGGKMYADAGYGIGQLTNNSPNYGEEFFRRMANRWGYPLP